MKPIKLAKPIPEPSRDMESVREGFVGHATDGRVGIKLNDHVFLLTREAAASLRDSLDAQLKFMDS